jgi:Pregnancy-associated plasma protein-A
MKKLLILFLFTITNFPILYAQACGYPTNTHVPDISPHTITGAWVNIYYHIVKRTNGTGSGITNANICKATRDINNIFNKYGIYFKQIGTDDITDDALYGFSGTENESNTLFGKRLRQDAINVYILPYIPGGGGCAKNIPSYALAVTESSVINSPSTISHEIGHCFGLYHTHMTTFGAELIDGSNGASAGDKISDTPADPNLEYNVSNCLYTGTATQNGIPYSPDPRNVMSYSGESCKDRFSPFQVNAMYNILLYNTYFDGIRASSLALPVPNINGSGTICLSGQQLSVNDVNAPFMVFWDSSDPSVATASNFFQRDATKITKYSDGFTTIKAMVTDFCQLYSLTKDIYVGKPTLLEGTYAYGSNTYSVSNPSTGIAVSSSSPSIHINLSQTAPDVQYFWSIASSGNSSGGPSNNSYLSANGNQAYIYLSGGNYMNIACNATNNCGNSPIITFNCYNYSYYQIIASPNPTSQNLTITANLVEDGGSTNRGEQLLRTKDINKTPVKLLDSANRIVASGKLTNGNFSFRLANIPNGTYYLHVSEGIDLITKQIIVQH